jgi:hypothetical protein
MILSDIQGFSRVLEVLSIWDSSRPPPQQQQQQQQLLTVVHQTTIVLNLSELCLCWESKKNLDWEIISQVVCTSLCVCVCCVCFKFVSLDHSSSSRQSLDSLKSRRHRVCNLWIKLFLFFLCCSTSSSIFPSSLVCWIAACLLYSRSYKKPLNFSLSLPPTE